MSTPENHFGLPDVAALARMANELFAAAPVAADPRLSQPPTEPPAFQAGVPAFPSELSLPLHPQFPSAPAGAGPAVVAPATVAAPSAPPAVPAGLGADSAYPAEFAFLSDARPLYGDRNTAPEAARTPAFPGTVPAAPSLPFADRGFSAAIPAAEPLAPPYTEPSGAQFSFLEQARPPQQLPLAGADSTATPLRFDELGFVEAFSLAQPPSPVYPEPPGGTGFLPGTPFSFLEEARPLFANPPLPPGSFGFFEEARPVSPGHVEQAPTGIEPDVPQDLKLSSFPMDAHAIKRDFPILKEKVNGRPLVWLDNAATTQKPQSVIDRLTYFYEHENSNVHRAAHELAARATDAYESAREKVRRFVNASSTKDIIFVRGATEGINLVAQAWGRRNVQKDDEIVITHLEHHANIVPWQMLCAEKGARLRVAPVDDSGQILFDEYEKLLNPRTRLVALPQVSNALGTVVPVAQMIDAAHRHGVPVLLDGAQSVSHMQVDVQALDCDFFVFSGHKVFAPTGIGVVYGKPEVLEHMPPWQGGGNMIQDVTFEKTIYQPAPQRFEAGTGNIADAVGLGAAIDYLDRVGMVNVSRHEHQLLEYATHLLLRIPGLRIIGTAKEKAGVLSFIIDGFRTEEIGQYLNRYGIAVRAGHHCAQPILRRFGLESTVRASLALYNTFEDIDALDCALKDLTHGHRAIQ